MGRKICIGWYDMTGQPHACGADHGPSDSATGHDNHGIYCPECQARSREALIAMKARQARAREARAAAQPESV